MYMLAMCLCFFASLLVHVMYHECQQPDMALLGTFVVQEETLTTKSYPVYTGDYRGSKD